MASELNQRVKLVREILESYLTPAVVGRVMYTALRQCAQPPTTDEQVAEFINDSIPFALGDFGGDLVGKADREAILERLEFLFTRGPASIPPPEAMIDISIDFDDETDDENGQRDPTITRAMPTSRFLPVPVLVATSDAHFGSFLEASMGFHRVEATGAATTDELARALTTMAPLVMIIDAVSPPAFSSAAALAEYEALSGDVILVLWGQETDYGHPIASRSEGVDRRMLLSADEGLDPVFDLIASRHA